jgi:hypothetical protein
MAIVDLAYQHALDRLAAVGFDALSEQERDFAAIWQVEARVINDGLVNYYTAATGDLAFHAPDALARVGAVGKAAIMRAANALFGPGGPPRDQQERQVAVKAFSPQVLATINELERRYVDDPVDVDDLVERAAGKGS